MKFKNWISLQELKFNSAGIDSQPTQTADTTAKVAQNWLAQGKNAPFQSQLLAQKSTSVLGPKLMDAGSQAIKAATPNIASQTTAPNVAAFLQTNLGLPKVITPTKPSQTRM